MNIHWVMEPEWDYQQTGFHLICDRGVIEHEWYGAKWHSKESKGVFASRRKETQGDRWEHYESLIAAIEGNERCVPNEIDGLAYMKIIDAALRSNRSGDWEEVDQESGL